MHYMHFTVFILSLNFIKYSLHPSPYLLPRKETKRTKPGGGLESGLGSKGTAFVGNLVIHSFSLSFTQEMFQEYTQYSSYRSGHCRYTKSLLKLEEMDKKEQTIMSLL